MSDDDKLVVYSVNDYFEGFPKIKRWNRDIIITEKIDGTNAQILIPDNRFYTFKSGRTVPFLVGSRTRWIFPENDNHGFAKWAYSNVDTILGLGPGKHFGEWWGQGIQRGYGLKEKRFSLFNTERWNKETLPNGIGVVPVLYKGPMYTVGEEEDTQAHSIIEYILERLRESGSWAASGYMKPEGIVIFHTASNHCYKVTLENDGMPKSLVV